MVEECSYGGRAEGGDKNNAKTDWAQIQGYEHCRV